MVESNIKLTSPKNCSISYNRFMLIMQGNINAISSEYIYEKSIEIKECFYRRV